MEEKKGISEMCFWRGRKNREEKKKIKREKKVMSSPFRVRQRIFFLYNITIDVRIIRCSFIIIRFPMGSIFWNEDQHSVDVGPGGAA